jgi:hypothetical protein
LLAGVSEPAFAAAGEFKTEKVEGTIEMPSVDNSFDADDFEASQYSQHSCTHVCRAPDHRETEQILGCERCGSQGGVAVARGVRGLTLLLVQAVAKGAPALIKKRIEQFIKEFEKL